MWSQGLLLRCWSARVSSCRDWHSSFHGSCLFSPPPELSVSPCKNMRDEPHLVVHLVVHLAKRTPPISSSSWPPALLRRRHAPTAPRDRLGLLVVRPLRLLLPLWRSLVPRPGDHVHDRVHHVGHHDVAKGGGWQHHHLHHSWIRGTTGWHLAGRPVKYSTSIFGLFLCCFQMDLRKFIWIFEASSLSSLVSQDCPTTSWLIATTSRRRWKPILQEASIFLRKPFRC